MNSRKNDNTTPLHLAAQYGMLDKTGVLLKHGADVGAEDGCGRTALQLASEFGYDYIVTLLSERGSR